MACPYFYPVARFESSPWTVPPRLPLGDAFSGVCRAPGAEQPDESLMRQVCNSGYGRQACSQFPAGAAADAIRFHVAQDAGKLIQIQFVLEKDCWPAERGTFEYQVTCGFAGAPADPTLCRQAEVYIQSYLRRRDIVQTGNQA